MGDVVDIAVIVKAIGRSSLTLVLPAFNNGRECVRGNFTAVAASLDTHRAFPIPGDIRTPIARSLAGGHVAPR